MDYNFKRIAEVEEMESVSEDTMFLVNDGGVIKQTHVQMQSDGGSEPMYVEFQAADSGNDGWFTNNIITDLTSDEWVAIGNDCLNDISKARNIAIRLYEYNDITQAFLIASQTSSCIYQDGLQIYFILPSPFNGYPQHGYIRLDFNTSDGWSIYAS